ncbi:hypothetical protein DHW03_00840 [Pedobacter yonginense]|uniref:Uncharacterized protein n=1 Tax=Pedobacter yonginense TaxID=651869 RepID=A0A317ET58_9SPHI|nr:MULTISPECIES: hypothetical protein [Pedobacter]PWS28436.1 hypothetical protein DHW03_00840 [Pedobacter yonginense]
MEWVYDNQQKEKEIFNDCLERYTLLKCISICLESLIKKGGNNENKMNGINLPIYKNERATRMLPLIN